MYQKQQKGIINNELCFDSVQEEDDMQFGGYAPSLGGGGDGRPTTAPDKRSVRFADDLGFDINDNDDADKLLSQQSRPKTAPAKNNTTSDYLDSPLEKSMSRDLFDNKKNPRNKKNIFELQIIILTFFRPSSLLLLRAVPLGAPFGRGG